MCYYFITIFAAVMFGLKNHVNDLQYSERFYYTNYEFYNDYDNPKNYINDITKVFHSCRRKTIPTITKYHQKIGTEDDENRSIRSNASFTEQQITMEQFLQAFTSTFQQNNYSDFSETSEEQRKNNFRIVYFPSEVHMRMGNNIAQKKPYWKKSLNSFEIINVLLDIQKESILNIMQLNQNEEISNEELDYYRYLLGFSELAYLTLYTFLKKDDEGVKTVNNFNAFRVLLEDIINSIMDGESCSHQILYIPNISMFSYFLNPALCTFQNFLIKSESYSKSESSFGEAFQPEVPRMVFINLDGIENPLNLEYIRCSFCSNLLYVTIFKQFEDINEVNDEVSHWYSKFLARLIYNCNHKPKQTGTQQKGSPLGCPKVMGFPLSSSYLKTKYEQNSQYENAYLSGSSSEISFLFQNSIYEQIRLFNPHIIFISYSGVLSIEQNHFNEIVRRLTVLCDHKIIIFPNLTNLFAKPHHLSELLQMVSSPDSKIQVDLKQQSQMSDLINIAKFVEECSSFEITDIDLNQFFNNLGMFNKISSGAYSFNQKRTIKSFEKFEVQNKLKYMEMLAKMEEFSYLQKYCSQNVNVNALGKMLQVQRDNILKANKEEVAFFAYFINQAIAIILEKPQQLPTKLRIRLVKLQQSLASKQKDLPAHLESKKKSILVECISREKIKKVFTIPKNIQHEPELKDIQALELFLINSKGDKQKILLDGFAQVIIDPLSTLIICTNYIDKTFHFCWLYGFIQPNKREVEMFVFRREEWHNLSFLYFQYSTYFCQMNGLLYLYWPYQWNILEENVSLLLDIKYEPRIVHKMLVISYKSLKPNLENPENYCLELKQHKLERVVKPRFGSTMYHSNGLLYIFGGYYDDKDDYSCLGSGVSVARMDYENKLYVVEDIGKDVLVGKLRPKANYHVQKVADKVVSLEGGYGREFTNYYNVYSYNRYLFNLQTHYLQLQQSTQRKLNALGVPMSNKKFGRYEAITFEHDQPQPIKLANSRRTMHRFIMRTDKGKVLSFINDEYTTTTHKENNRAEVLFDIHRKIANIYTHTHHSPEIFIRRANIKNEIYNNILRVELLTHLGDKHSDYISSNIIFPYEDWLISIAIHSSSHIIYILADSPTYTKQVNILYQARLDNINDILERREIIFKKYFQFSTKYYNVKDKSVACIGGSVGVFGGEIGAQGFRQDYIVDELRGVTRAKAIKFSYEEEPEILTMNNCYIIANPQNKQDQIMLYSLYLDSENHWQLKLQLICLSTRRSTITISHLTTCTIINNSMCQFHPELKQPRIVSIERYYILNTDTLKNQYLLLLNRIMQIMENNEYFVEDKQLVEAIGELLLDVINNLPKIYECLVNYGDIISSNVSRYGENPELQQYVNDLLCSTVTLHLEQVCLKVIHNPEEKELYRFFFQDKRLPLVKYIGISQLNTNSIVFFRVKFNKNVGINLKNYAEQVNKKTGASSLYGCNLGRNVLNKIIFSDEEFMNRFTAGNESIPVVEIEPFEAEVQQYEVEMQMYAQSNSF